MNKGFIVNGGTVNANNIAVGSHASISKINEVCGKQDPNINDLKQVMAELNKVIDENKEHLDKNVVASADLVSNEINSDKPNKLLIDSVLDGISSASERVLPLVGAIKSVKSLIAVLL
jgi:hypothetical protein